MSAYKFTNYLSESTEIFQIETIYMKLLAFVEQHTTYIPGEKLETPINLNWNLDFRNLCRSCRYTCIIKISFVD